jgi:hypothetical protein
MKNLVFLMFASVCFAGEINGRLNLRDVEHALSDDLGRLVPQKVLPLIASDRVNFKNSEGQIFKGVVTQRVEVPGDFIKILGTIDSEKASRVGFGFYFNKDGKFIGTVVNTTNGEQWHYMWLAEVQGYILIKDITQFNQA